MSTARARANGKPAPQPLGDLEQAKVIIETARTRQAPDRAIAGRLDPIFGEGALLAEQDGDQGIDHWIRTVEVRDPARAESIRLAIDTVQSDVDADAPAEHADADDEPTGKPRRTDLGNARRLVAKFGEKIRYCYAWGKWLIFDGRRWAEDQKGQIYRLAKKTVASIYAEAAAATDEQTREALGKWAMTSESRSRIEAMVALAQSEPGIPVTPDELDRDPWLLNVLNGTIDLRTGRLGPHRREDLITRMAPTKFDPKATCPTWDAFLFRIMGQDEELIGFLARASGYALTGDVGEQCLFFLHGTGANGKSTYLNTFESILGDYAVTVRSDLLTSKNTEDHPTGLCDLEGKRLVSTIEVEDGKRLAEALIKSMTGGDKIRARRMRQDFYQFHPTFKLFLAANHKPQVRGTDHAIWRRIKLVPFAITIPDAEKDKALGQKLLDERAGILAWFVRGCLDWQRQGLSVPKVVAEATDGYRKEMDDLATFLDQCCFAHPGNESVRCNSTILYNVYKNWCEENGIKAPVSSKKFGGELNARGFMHKDSNGVRWRLGLGILSERLPAGHDGRKRSLSDDHHSPQTIAGQQGSEKASDDRSGFPV
jgi:putative DNA primase/helicase